MPAVVFTMLVILGLAAAVIAVVVMGMEGTGRAKHPEIADAMARTARHLNGEGEPPRGLLMLFDEVNEVSAADLDPRKVPTRIKESIASARTARSAVSAASADAPEADETAPTAAAAPLAAEDSAGDAGDEETIPQDRVRAWLDSDEAADEDDAWLPAALPADRDADTADDMARALESDPADAFDDPYGVVDPGEDGDVVHVDLSRKP